MEQAKGVASPILEHAAAGQVTKVTDWLGHVTRFAYDTAGRRVSKTDALGHVERYGCDRVTTITDGRNKVRTYRYALRGEVAQLTLPDNSTERYRYDAGGNQTVRINGMGQTTTYAYDAADNLASVTYPSGPGVTYAYDLDGRTTSMTDGTGTSSWSYDNADRTTSLVTPQGSQSYGYDPYGNRTVVGMENGAAIQTNVLGGQVVSVFKSPENETTQYAYDNVGRLLTQTLPNGAITTYGYDALSRVNGIVHRRPGNPGSVISSESYQYDAGGNLTTKVVDGVRTDYAYDATDQLLSETTAGSSLSYTYDANGNRLTKTANGVTETYAYDDGDKLLSRSGALTGGVNYAYDACGRTTSVASTAGGGTTTLSYDYEDRLTHLEGLGVSESYVYNGADARVGKSGTAGSRTYRRDGVGVTSPVLSDGLATMVPGISERSNGVTRFSHLDRLGTNAKTSDASASVVDSRSYDAFGLPTQVTNPSHSEQGFASAFGYQEDAESGLKLLGHRYYDPGAGRFITRDPSGNGTNWYKYADNNPLKSVDPSGLDFIQISQKYDAEHGTNYYNQTEEYIGNLSANGEAEAAARLQGLLEQGLITVDTDLSHFKGKVRFHDGTVGDSGAKTDAGGIVLPGNFFTANTPYYIEVALLHESVHWKDYKDGLPGNELHATNVASAYAQRRSGEAAANLDSRGAAGWDREATREASYGRSQDYNSLPILLWYARKRLGWGLGW